MWANWEVNYRYRETGWFIFSPVKKVNQKLTLLRKYWAFQELGFNNPNFVDRKIVLILGNRAWEKHFGKAKKNQFLEPWVLHRK
jgi:hypothetical protein